MIVSATGLLTEVASAVAVGEVEADLLKEWLRRRGLSGIPVSEKGLRMGTQVSNQQEKPQRSPKSVINELLGDLLCSLPAPRRLLFSVHLRR
jgi:hypothetical protein